MAEQQSSNESLDENVDDPKRKDDMKDKACGDAECKVMPGSKLDDKQTFTDVNDHTVNALPVLIDFKRLFQLGKADSGDNNTWIIDGISNKDLLHAVVGLYDISLSEMTPDVLYATICEKWARTVVLVRDTEEVLEDVKNRNNTDENSEAEDSKSGEMVTTDVPMEASSVAADKDVFQPEVCKSSIFSHVFSDGEEADEEEEQCDDEDFSKGINSFIKDATARRKHRKKEIKEENIGVESRLIGCATFEKKFINHTDRVIHLTLISVRQRFRKYGIGKYLLSLVTSQNVVGSYEAVVVHADNAAITFFQKYGFSDDIVLNSRFSELAEQFTNCTLMCFLPGFSGTTLLKTSKVAGVEIFELELDFNRWKDKTLEAYQAQVGLVMRMKHEILHLKSIIKTQADLLVRVAVENNRLKIQKLNIEKDFFAYKLSQVASKSMALQQSTAQQLNNHHEGDDDDDTGDEICTEDLIANLQRQVDVVQASLQDKYLQAISSECGAAHTITSIGSSNYVSFPSACVRSQQDPYDHTQDASMFYNITEQFVQSMKADPSVKMAYEVTSIAKATLSETVKESFNKRRQKLHDPDMVTDLYYCGSSEKPNRIPEILQHGFTEQDFSEGEYGRGLYFSKYPSTAEQFSARGQVLLAEVGLGTVETIVKADHSRTKANDGSDSIITPGRLNKQNCTENLMLEQEYVVFDVNQVKPICLISYQVAT